MILCILVDLTTIHFLLAQPMQFTNAGPSRGGRVTAVTGVESEPNVFYMGASGGGLWKSIDYGIHWTNISDGYFETPSIGAIGVFQKNPDILYVGTGSDAIRSNVIVGKGIYKTFDAGETWTHTGLRNGGQIGALEIHPENPNVVFAAVLGQPFRKSKERGVYRTKDGGNTWEQVLFHSDSVGAIDLEFAPDNPNMIYACMWRGARKPWTVISGGATDGIFKSADGGNTWRRLKRGLPTSLFGKSDLAVSMDNPARVWAQIQASDGQEGLYRSDDYGENWSKVELSESVRKSVMYRPFYFTNLDVNPKNTDNLWAGTKQLWTSYNGGKDWKKITPPHADHHDMWINPNDTSVMIVGNDGGGSVSRDGGQNWSHQFNQPTAELYTCDVDDQYPYYVYSGQQDNSTIRVPSQNPRQNVLSSNDRTGLDEIMYWEKVGGCETGPVVPKPGDPQTVYANCKGQFSVYNHLTGDEMSYYVGAESLYGNHPDEITYRFQRVTPIEVSPHDPNTVYYGSQFLHKTIDGGKNWQTISKDLTANEPAYRMRSGGPIDEDISGEEYYAVLYAIQESPVTKGIIWTGSNDGLFHLSKDGGRTWRNVTPNMPPGGRVSNIEASPHNPGKAYFAVYRDYLGDDKPYLYKTSDFGETWTLLSTEVRGFSIDHPTRSIREDTQREGLLFAGTEFGLLVSFDDGLKWYTFQRNLPIVPVTDIQIFRNDLIISTLGRSFWILNDMTPLREFDPERKTPFKVFEPRDIHQANQYIHFMLTQNEVDTLVTFEFKKDGQLVHAKQENLKKLKPDQWGIRKTTWDLRYYLKNGKKDFRGPLVSPGNYTVTVTYGNDSATAEFDFLISPELRQLGVTEEDLRKQEKLAYRTANMYVEIDHTIRKLQIQLEKTKSERKKRFLLNKLKQLKKGPKRYDKPMLIDHTKYLYELVSDTQQPVGQDAFDRYRMLRLEWEKFKR